MKQVAQTVLTGHKRDRVMSNEINSESDPGQPLDYQIRIKGHLGREWTDWVGGLTLSLEDNGETLLTGPVVDQAALYGLLRKVRDVAMPLLSVVCMKPDQAVAKARQTGKERLNQRELGGIHGSTIWGS